MARNSAGRFDELLLTIELIYQMLHNVGSAPKIRDFALPSDPKARLQRLLTISAIVIGYFFVWTFQDFLKIHVALIDITTLLRLPIISIIVFPLVKYGYVKQDWLQRGRPSLKSVRFFQLQFPSAYIRERCHRCIETEQTCKNYITPESRDNTGYWLDYIFPIIKRDQKEQADRAFERGYTCKLIFGLQVVLLFFAVTSVLMAASKLAFSVIARQAVSGSLTPPQVIFIVLCLCIAGALRALHRPDLSSPTGCWHAWREINDALKLWMKNNEPALVEIVCHAGGNDKSFAPRQ